MGIRFTKRAKVECQPETVDEPVDEPVPDGLYMKIYGDAVNGYCVDIYDGKKRVVERLGKPRYPYYNQKDKDHYSVDAAKKAGRAYIERLRKQKELEAEELRLQKETAVNLIVKP